MITGTYPTIASLEAAHEAYRNVREAAQVNHRVRVAHHMITLDVPYAELDAEHGRYATTFRAMGAERDMLEAIKAALDILEPEDIKRAIEDAYRIEHARILDMVHMAGASHRTAQRIIINAYCGNAEAYAAEWLEYARA